MERSETPWVGMVEQERTFRVSRAALIDLVPQGGEEHKPCLSLVSPACAQRPYLPTRFTACSTLCGADGAAPFHCCPKEAKILFKALRTAARNNFPPALLCFLRLGALLRGHGVEQDRELALKTWQPCSAPYRRDTRPHSGTRAWALRAPGAGPAGDPLPRRQPAPRASSRARGTGQPRQGLGPGRARGGSLPAARGPAGQQPGRWHGRHTGRQPGRNQAQ